MIADRVFAVVTGGGTSGHVVPAMAIIEALEDAGVGSDQLAYVGAMRGVETTLIPELGIRAAYLPISGLQRSMAPRGILRNLALPFRLLRSSVAARRLIGEWNPRVVVSVGGYASEPMTRVALRRGIPVVCVSYDRTPGLATRRQARKSTLNLVAFPDSPLPGAKVVGAPVRRSVRAIDRSINRDVARDALGVPRGVPFLAIVGGSLGSAALNEFVGALVGVPEAAGIAVLHVCGERYVGEPSPRVADGVWYRRIGYTNQMSDVLASVDLIVCRAGASTVNEIACVGVPSVVVPWSGSAGGHQVLNARWLADEHAAVMLDEKELADSESVERVLSLLRDASALESMSAKCRSLGDSVRTGRLAEAIVSVAADRNMEQWSTHG